MIRIAVIDDDIMTCHAIEQQLLHVSKELMCRVSVDVFQSGERFIETMEQCEQYDLIILDIELVEMNGIDVGDYIRSAQHDQYVQIVFISAKQGYMKQLFDIRPMNFFEKPVTTEQIKKCLQTYMELFPEDEVFRCRVGKAIRQLSYRHVLYFRSENKEIAVLTNDEVFHFYGRLSDVELLTPSFFIRVHKSFLINQNYISVYHIDSVQMSNGDLVPISRRYQAETRRKMMQLYTIGGDEIFDTSNRI